MAKYDHIDFKPPKSVQEAAKRGLELRKENNGKGGLSTQEASKQGIGSGVARATSLSNGQKQSSETIRKMYNFFNRHENSKKVDKGKKKSEDKGYIAWCLKYDSEILLANGDTKTIKEIVDNKLEVEVLSYNEKLNIFEPKPITGWSKAPSSIKDFFIVGKDKCSRQGLSNKTFVAATSEHPFFTKGKWVEAKNMKNETISVIDMSLDEISEQILLGTMLGDSYIYKCSKDTGILKIAHGDSQQEYIKEKARLLYPLNMKYYNYISKKGFNEGKISHCMNSAGSLYLSNICNLFYKNGKKVVTKKVLYKIGDVGLAFWLMDDGKLKYNKRDGFGSWILHTEGFCKNSINEIIDFFKEKYKIQVVAHRRENANGSYIYFNTENTKKIMPLLAKYFHPSMRYKLYPKYRDVEYYFEKFTPSTSKKIFEQNVTKFGKASELYKSTAAKKPYKWKYRYNLEVADNHNYIANGIIVHNCLWGGDPGRSWANKVYKQMEAADKKEKDKKASEIIFLIKEASENEPTDSALWSRCKAKAKKKFDVYPSAYANAWAAKEYKRLGGKWKKKKKSNQENDIIKLNKVHNDSGLGKWFDEEWVRREKEDGKVKYKPCGRKDADKGKYPKCQPKNKWKNMSKNEADSAVRRKRKEEPKDTEKSQGRKPNYVSTKKKSSLDNLFDTIYKSAQILQPGESAPSASAIVADAMQIAKVLDPGMISSWWGDYPAYDAMKDISNNLSVSKERRNAALSSAEELNKLNRDQVDKVKYILKNWNKY